MATSSRNRHELTEPPEPAFVVELRHMLDLAVSRNEAAVTAEHAYTGWVAGYDTVNGWSTRIARRAEPGRFMEVFYDALDEDVCIYGTAEYREWKWEPGDDAAARGCLNELDQLVEAFASSQLAEPSPRRANHVPAFVLSVLAAGAGITRLRRRPR